MPDLTQYLWILWLSFILICVIIELLSLEFTFLMIAIGSLAGLGANLVGAVWWLQIVVAAVLSVLLLLTIRPLLLRIMTKDADQTPSNVAALIGLSGRVMSTVGATGGLVKLANGETWTARLASGPDSGPIEPGTQVSVTAIEGSTAVVLPSERNTP